jgi:UDP-MurNAc hydroxylase
MLTVDFFGQACTATRCHRTGIEIVSDPWFSDTAHLDSWHAYPEWTPTEQETIRQRLDRATHVYLSHNHADHFDPEFLRGLSSKTIIVGDFQNKRFREQLRELKNRHEIRFVRHGEVVPLNDCVSIQIFLQQPAFRIDSRMLLKAPDAVVLNANDWIRFRYS